MSNICACYCTGLHEGFRATVAGLGAPPCPEVSFSSPTGFSELFRYNGYMPALTINCNDCRFTLVTHHTRPPSPPDPEHCTDNGPAAAPPAASRSTPALASTPRPAGRFPGPASACVPAPPSLPTPPPPPRRPPRRPCRGAWRRRCAPRSRRFGTSAQRLGRTECPRCWVPRRRCKPIRPLRCLRSWTRARRCLCARGGGNPACRPARN